jgi:hypothetical protein
MVTVFVAVEKFHLFPVPRWTKKAVVLSVALPEVNNNK